MDCELAFNIEKFIELFPVYVGAFGAIALLWATYLQVKSAKKDASKRAAFEYFNQEAQSEEAAALEAYLNGLKINHADSEELFGLAASNPEANIKVSLYVRQLNMLAMGILNKGICEDFAKEYACDHLISEWQYFENYIIRLRQYTSNPNIGGALEKVAVKWSEKEVT